MLGYLWLIPLGVLVGGYGTLIGAGGGFVLMPVLLLLYPGEDRVLLAAISLAVVFFNALSGSVAYGRMRRIDYRSGMMFAAATIPGAVPGALTTSRLPRGLFDGSLAVLLLIVSVFLLFNPAGRSEGREGTGGFLLARRFTGVGFLCHIGRAGARPRL